MEQTATVDVTGAPAPTQEAAASQEQPQQDSLAPKFAALAKKEKWARKLAEDAKKQMEDVKKRMDSWEQEKTQYVPKSKIKEDFLNVAMEAGLTPDQIANILLNNTSGAQQIDPTLLELRNEIKSLKQELLQTKTGWEDNKKSEYTHAVNQIRNEATKLVDTNPEYETIKAKGLVDKVVQYIEDTYKEDGIVIPTEEACREVEQALVEDALAAFNGSKKVQERLKALTAPKEEPPKQQLTQQSQPKTLTNGMTPTSAKPRLTERERIRRATLRAQGLDPDAVSP